MQAAQVVPVEEGEASSGPFLGGSILASLGSFAEFVVTKAEYEESGVDAVDRKCP